MKCEQNTKNKVQEHSRGLHVMSTMSVEHPYVPKKEMICLVYCLEWSQYPLTSF